MSEKTVVITGGNGFVGRHLAQELKREEPEKRIVVWDRSLEGLADGVEGVKMDITKPETYRESLKSEQPAWIVHLAAVPSATLASQNEEYARQVNVEGTRRLLEEARRVSPNTRALVVSSADIYGNIMESPPPSLRLAAELRRAGLPELPLKQARPRNVYAQTKWEMEQVVEQHFNDLVIRARPFPHIGPGQARGYVTADFASQIVAAETGRGEPVIKVGNLEARRDFTDARDVVRAYRLLMESGVYGEACPAAERERGVCGVYNVASGRAVSIQHILDKLLELSEVEVEVEQDPKLMRPTDIPVLVGDSAKLRELTGWRPTISLDRSLKDVIGWWRKNVVL